MRRVVLVVLFLVALVAALTSGPDLWASPGQEPQRQTVPTRTPTAPPAPPTPSGGAPPPTLPPTAPPAPTDTPTLALPSTPLLAATLPVSSLTPTPPPAPVVPVDLTATAHTLHLPIVGEQTVESATATPSATATATGQAVIPPTDTGGAVVLGGISPLCFLGAALFLLGFFVILFAARGRRGG